MQTTSMLSTYNHSKAPGEYTYLYSQVIPKPALLAQSSLSKCLEPYGSTTKRWNFHSFQQFPCQVTAQRSWWWKHVIEVFKCMFLWTWSIQGTGRSQSWMGWNIKHSSRIIGFFTRDYLLSSIVKLLISWKKWWWWGMARHYFLELCKVVGIPPNLNYPCHRWTSCQHPLYQSTIYLRSTRSFAFSSIFSSKHLSCFVMLINNILVKAF